MLAHFATIQSHHPTSYSNTSPHVSVFVTFSDVCHRASKFFIPRKMLIDTEVMVG